MDPRSIRGKAAPNTASTSNAALDSLTEVAAALFNAEVVFISLAGAAEGEQTIASAPWMAGPAANAPEIPATRIFCDLVISQAESLAVEDTASHPLTAAKADHASGFAYLGAPLVTDEGAVVGAFSVVGKAPRAWTRQDDANLRSLAAAATENISLMNALSVTTRIMEGPAHASHSASRFGRVVERAHHEVFTFDAETLLFSDVNRGARENIGYSLDELQKMTPIDIKPYFDRKAFNAAIAPLYSGEMSELIFETIHERKDRTTYPCSIRLELHPEGENGLFVAFVKDMTEQRNLEEELRLNEELRQMSAKFEALFHTSPDALVFADLDFRVEYANGPYAGLYGKTPAQMIGVHTYDLPSATTREDLEKMVRNCTPESPTDIHMQELEVDGEMRSMFWSRFVIYEGNEPRRLGGIGRDVTDLYNAKIFAEQKASEAEAANHAKSAFLANMSHEIRTPLNGVIGMASALGMTPLSATQKRYLDVVSGAGNHLLELINDILDLAKVESEEISLEHEVFDEEALAREAVSLYRPRADEKGLALSFDAPGRIGDLLVGNDRRIRQVLNNLVSNAIKFTASGSVTVRTFLDDMPGKGEADLRIVVRDTGVGVPDDQKNLIFGRFNQGDHTVDQHIGGIGLGLTISRTICELHGGDLRVEDTPGGGATFTASFAIRYAPPVSASSREHDAASALTDLKEPLRLIVAEDNAINQTVIKSLLLNFPVEVTCVWNGKEALDLMARQKFDAALIDIRMPVLDGLSFVEIHRANEAADRRMPLVAFSANAMRHQIDSYLKAGFDRHISKPVDMQTVEACLLWMLEQSSDRQRRSLSKSMHSAA